MSNDKLKNLSLLYIENEILNSINTDDIIEKFIIEKRRIKKF